MSFSTISLEELENYLGCHGNPFIVDLRNQSSYNKCHLKGAINIPFCRLEWSLEQIPSDQPVILYCSRGGQSMRASRYLSQMGYQIINVAGGINFYRGKYLQWM